VNVVMDLQAPQTAGNVACFLPVRAKDLSARLYNTYCFYTATVVARTLLLLPHSRLPLSFVLRLLIRE